MCNVVLLAEHGGVCVVVLLAERGGVCDVVVLAERGGVCDVVLLAERGGVCDIVLLAERGGVCDVVVLVERCCACWQRIGHGERGDRHGDRAGGRHQDDGPRQAAKEGADRHRDRGAQGLPAPEHRQLRRLLPGELQRQRLPVGGDGVPAGRRAHRRRHRDGAERGPDRRHLLRVPEGARVPACARHHPPRHQERQRAARHGRRGEAHRLRVLRADHAGPRPPLHDGRHALLDGSGGRHQVSRRSLKVPWIDLVWNFLFVFAQITCCDDVAVLNVDAGRVD